MRIPFFFSATLLLGVTINAFAVREAVISDYQGRPTVFVDNQPTALVTVNPMNLDKPGFERTAAFFTALNPDAYIVQKNRARVKNDWTAKTLWVGDTISEESLLETVFSLDEQINFILERDPDALFIIRFDHNEPATWRELHPDELFVSEDGKVLPVPSLASVKYREMAAAYAKALIRYCERQDWADRIIGYANFTRHEGTHEPLMEHLLYDHSPVMTAAWRDFLRNRYHTVEALREAYGDDTLTFDTIPVPGDVLRGTVPEVSQILYWQPASKNQPMRDYLTLTAQLYHQQFRAVAAAMKEGLGERQRLLVYDALKQPMQGWTNFGFFNDRYSWPLAYAELMAGSGHMGVEELMDAPGFDGLITPHDYTTRDTTGIYEPEGAADSVVLRGRYFFVEMDTRTYNQRRYDAYGLAKDEQEFAAITWRNVATSLARGLNSYPMELYTDWFNRPEFIPILKRQFEVMRESVEWPHHTPPGIAVVIDDRAVLETNGDGRYLNEAVMMQLKAGLPRSGVPYRIYLLEDLALDHFPDHRVFYFPNLFKVDDERLALLQEKVFGEGRVVVWGPGSGISDGQTLNTGHATRLTGFDFERLLPLNHPRRAIINHFDHPLTRDLPADTLLGGSLAYGPILFPRDGVSLARAWTKQNRVVSGLSVKTIGEGEEAWTSVFTTALPLPADLWRRFAVEAGAHVYTNENDLIQAGGQIVALTSIKSGSKTIELPQASQVWDVIRDEAVSDSTTQITFDLEAPATAVFRVIPVP